MDRLDHNLADYPNIQTSHPVSACNHVNCDKLDNGVDSSVALKVTHWDMLSHVVGTLRDSTTVFSQEEAMDHKEPEGPAKQEDDLIEEATKASPNGARGRATNKHGEQFQKNNMN